MIYSEYLRSPVYTNHTAIPCAQSTHKKASEPVTCVLKLNQANSMDL